MDVKQRKKKKDRTAGVFRPDEAYTLAELRERARMGSWAIREARKKGLVVRTVGNARFVLGVDFIRFLTECAKVEDSPAKPGEK